MEENKVVDINENKIVLTNAEIAAFLNMVTPDSRAFNKLRSLTYVSGKLQYWVFKLEKKLTEAFKEIDEVRINSIKHHCIKGKNGEPVFSDAKYKFTKENEEARLAEIKAQEELEKDFKEGEALKSKDPAFLKELDLEYCERDKDGDPIMVGGNNVTFDDEGMAAFQKDYAELMTVSNIFPINRIKIDSATLEKINSSGKEKLTVEDMVVLEKLFEFVE